MKKLSDNILCWCENPAEEIIKEATIIANHPYLSGNVCLLPNVCYIPNEYGVYGTLTGCVTAFKDAICPNLVGADIGCGIKLFKTSINNIPSDKLKLIKDMIKTEIPLRSTKGIHARCSLSISMRFNSKIWNDTIICKELLATIRRQRLTLGGCGHFIEILKDDDSNFWFMIHSGAVYISTIVKEYYNEAANKICSTCKQDDLVQQGLAILPKGIKEYDDYIKEMNMCIAIAEDNRVLISEYIKRIIALVLEQEVEIYDNYSSVHNYAQLEQHNDADVWVHRKGAISAQKDEICIIPGSAGKVSYIGQGIGNPDSMYSCSNGAGRTMSLRQARLTLNLEEEQKKISDSGILYEINTIADLDGAPSAYKDVDIVMNEQSDLVTIVKKLTPIALIKY